MEIGEKTLVDDVGQVFFVQEMGKNHTVLFVDIDGTYTDGLIMYDWEGKASRQFHTRDSHALANATSHGIFPILISGSNDSNIHNRALSLKIPFVHSKRKLVEANDIVVAYFPNATKATIGDGKNDLELMKWSDIVWCPADADQKVRIYILDRHKENGTARKSTFNGGRGAISAFIDFLSYS